MQSPATKTAEASSLSGSSTSVTVATLCALRSDDEPLSNAVVLSRSMSSLNMASRKKSSCVASLASRSCGGICGSNAATVSGSNFEKTDPVDKNLSFSDSKRRNPASTLASYPLRTNRSPQNAHTPAPTAFSLPHAWQTFIPSSVTSYLYVISN